MRAYDGFKAQYPHINHRQDLATSISLWIAALSLKGLAAPSIHSYVSAVKATLLEEGVDAAVIGTDGGIRAALEGVDRGEPHSKTKKKAALTAELFLAALPKAFPHGVVAFEDRVGLAAMAMGIFGIMRPGEFVTTDAAQSQDAILTLAQIDTSSLATIIINLKRSKTDQKGKGTRVVIAQPEAAQIISAYLNQHPQRSDPSSRVFVNKDGSPFLNSQLQGYIKSFLGKAQVASPQNYSSRSLRKGGAQSLHDADVPIAQIANAGRWSNPITPFTHYITPSIQSAARTSRRMGS